MKSTYHKWNMHLTIYMYASKMQIYAIAEKIQFIVARNVKVMKAISKIVREKFYVTNNYNTQISNMTQISLLLKTKN